MSLINLFGNGITMEEKPRQVSKFEEKVRRTISQVKKDYINGLKKNKRVVDGLTYELKNGIVTVYNENDKKNSYMYILTIFLKPSSQRDGELIWIHDGSLINWES